MAFDKHTLTHLTHLARLSLNPEEAERLFEQLRTIMTLVDQVAQVDTQNTEPMAHPIPGTYQRERTDTLMPVTSRDALLSQAPACEAGLFLVPKVIDDEASS